jgi:hypothetical protein
MAPVPNSMSGYVDMPGILKKSIHTFFLHDLRPILKKNIFKVFAPKSERTCAADFVSRFLTRSFLPFLEERMRSSIS